MITFSLSHRQTTNFVSFDDGLSTFVSLTYYILQNVGQDFILTFYYRFPEFRGTVYFSFCYPWSYTESLQQMDSLDAKYADADENIKNRYLLWNII